MILAGFCTLVFFANLSQREFLVESSTSFCLWSITDYYRQFWMRNRFKKELFRSSRPEMSCKKGVLKNFAKFTGKYLCQSLFFNEVVGEIF